MNFRRRGIMRGLAIAFGSGVVSRWNEPAEAAQQAAQMEKVTGIGGLFFRAHDPKALRLWYQQNLGISIVPSSYGESPWQQEAGPTAFMPFPESTKYFDPGKAWMVNFRVRDLDKMAAQLRAAGTEVKIDPQTYPNGRFAHLKDPEGNPIELWQPEKSAGAH